MSGLGIIDSYWAVILPAVGGTLGLYLMKNFMVQIPDEMIEAAKENPDPLELTAPDVRRLLKDSGVPEENLEDFEETFEKMAGDRAVFAASNIAEKGAFTVESPNIKVKVDPAYADLLETRIIDGRPCLIIPVDSRVEVNGILVKTTLTEEEPSALEEVIE